MNCTSRFSADFLTFEKSEKTHRINTVVFLCVVNTIRWFFFTSLVEDAFVCVCVCFSLFSPPVGGKEDYGPICTQALKTKKRKVSSTTLNSERYAHLFRHL